MKNSLSHFIFFIILSGMVLFSPVGHSGETGEMIPFQLQQTPSEKKVPPKVLNPQVEDLLVKETNEVRKKKKRVLLTVNPLLRKAATDHSRDMMNRHYLSHFSPEGKSVLDRVGRYVHEIHTSVGENLHTIQSGHGLSDPQAIAHLMMSDWMHSPSHRDNIISKQFTQVGVGCVSNGFQIYCTQVFSGPNL